MQIQLDITKQNVIANIFKNRLYFFMLVVSFIIAVLLPISAQKIVAPSFYEQMLKNTLEDAKKVGKHIARHQNHDVRSTVFYTAIDKLKDDFKIVKIRLFDEKGKIVFSTQTDEIGNVNTKSYYFDIVAKGKMFYKIVQKGEKSLDGNDILKDVAEIYVPIIEDGIFKGSSEIYYDITHKHNAFKVLLKKVNILYYMFALLFILVSWAIVYILSKNNLKDHILEQELKNEVDKKTKQLQEMNQNLEKRISQEIEKNREKETQLFQQSKLASMGEMIGNIAHQWRQPLSAISSSASSAKMQIELGILTDKESSEIYGKIMEKATFLSETIESFRNFFKTDKEKIDFDLAALIVSVENIIASNYKNEYISILNEFEGEKFIKGVPGELSQVILNILNNSYDNFIVKKIEKRFVKVSLSDVDEKVVIKITDNGGGIPEDIMEKVFEPYFTTKHQSQGTGIGLYMCSQIVKKHFKGDITVKNENIEIEGENFIGASFSITLNKS